VITLLENNPQTGFCRFFIDKEADILELPTHLHGGINSYKNAVCSYGSIAECLSGKTYRLSGEDEWVVYKGSSSSSGSVTPPSGDCEEDIEPITDDEINSLFKNN